MVSQFPGCPDWRDKFIILGDGHIDIENDAFRSGFTHAENPLLAEPSLKTFKFTIIDSSTFKTQLY